jgi:hypothetical protein
VGKIGQIWPGRQHWKKGILVDFWGFLGFFKNLEVLMFFEEFWILKTIIYGIFGLLRMLMEYFEISGFFSEY